MKLVRVLLRRLVLLLVFAAAFVALGETYRSFMRHHILRNALSNGGSWSSGPEIVWFPDLIYRATLLAFFCLAGRVLFRLRLNPAPRGEGQPVLLDLRQENQQSPKPSPAAADVPPPAR